MIRIRRIRIRFGRPEEPHPEPLPVAGPYAVNVTIGGQPTRVWATWRSPQIMAAGLPFEPGMCGQPITGDGFPRGTVVVAVTSAGTALVSKPHSMAPPGLAPETLARMAGYLP